MTQKKSLVEYQNEINELIYNESLQEEEQTNYLSIVLKDKLNAIDEKIINDNTDNTKTNTITRRGRDR